MLRKIELPDWVAGRAPRIVTRRQLGEAKHAENILAHARALARQTTDQAHADAEALRQRSTQEAYHQAFRRAAAPIASFLADAVNLHQKLLRDAQETLAEQLRAAGCNPDIVHDFLTSQLPAGDTSPALVIHTPKDYPQRAELDVLLRARFDDVQWRHTTSEGSYAIEVGDQAWEVDFAANAQASAQTIMTHTQTSTEYEKTSTALINTLHDTLLKNTPLPASHHINHRPTPKKSHDERHFRLDPTQLRPTDIHQPAPQR